MDENEKGRILKNDLFLFSLDWNNAAKEAIDMKN